jgi:hypothetical protein
MRRDAGEPIVHLKPLFWRIINHATLLIIEEEVARAFRCAAGDERCAGIVAKGSNAASVVARRSRWALMIVLWTNGEVLGAVLQAGG